MFSNILLTYILIKAINFYQILILISVISSWIDFGGLSWIIREINKLTNPYLKIFRVFIPLGNSMLDLSPIIAIFVLDIVKRLIINIL